MSITTIPALPFKVGDVLEMKTSPKGVYEKVKIMGFNPKPKKDFKNKKMAINIMVKTLDERKRKRPKRIVLQLFLTSEGKWENRYKNLKP